MACCDNNTYSHTHPLINFMPSTVRTTDHVAQEQASPLRWRCWPLMDHPRWSWLAVALVIVVVGFVWYFGGGWFLSVAAAIGLAATIWQFWVPIDYEIDPLGVRRYAARRTRLVPWHAVRAYQLRPTGVVLYPHGDPTKLDLLRSMFVPFPPHTDQADQIVSTMREHLAHAKELPQ